MKVREWMGVCAVVLFLVAGGRALADAGVDWDQIEAMDKNPPSTQWKSRAEAEAGALEYLGRQEQALRSFIVAYPADAHAPDAKLRLAHLMATRADLQQNPAERRKADALLDEVEQEPGMRDRRADVEFARISIFMQRVDAITGENRTTLLAKARGFAKEFPDDRRVAALLAEVASAYDDQPKTERALLEEARPKAKTAELQARIADDLKRLDLLGKRLDMQWTSVQGTRIDVAKMRGKVVLIYFFASWSSPSMFELDWVKQLSGRMYPESIQTLGICLDNDPVAVTTILAGRGISWPVFCDGRGWQGELVRSYGINALPVLWVVDRKGVLRTLDAKGDAEAMIDKMARE